MGNVLGREANCSGGKMSGGICSRRHVQQKCPTLRDVPSKRRPYVRSIIVHSAHNDSALDKFTRYITLL